MKAGDVEQAEVLEKAVNSQSDSLEAQFRVLKYIGQDKMNYGTAQRLGQRAGEQDPESYVGWVCALPETVYGEFPRRRFFDAWTVRDPAAASAWLTTLPEGKGKTDSIIGFIWGAIDVPEPNVEGIEAWLKEIQPRDEREKWERYVWEKLGKR